MKKLILFTSIVFMYITTRAQIVKYGATASVGISAVPNFSSYHYQYNTSPGLTFDIGGIGQKSVGKNSFLEIEFKWTRLKSKEVLIAKDIKGESELTFSHFVLPILYRIQKGKTGFNGGILPSIFVNGSYKSINTFYDGDDIIKAVRSIDYLNNDKPFSIGLTAGLDYLLNSSVRATLKSSFRIRNYSNQFSVFDDSFIFDRNHFQVTLGFDYIVQQ